MVGAVILAAGKGERMGGVDKAFATVAHLPMLAHSLLAFERCRDIDAIVVVAREGLLGRAREIAAEHGIAKFRAAVAGGAERQASSLAGIRALPEADIVAVHDAARPLVTDALISKCVAFARACGSGVVARRVRDTIREAAPSGAFRLLDRNRLWAAETPQVFARAALLAALESAEEAGASLADDAAAIERTGGGITLVEWNEPNLKVTVEEDLRVADALLAAREESPRHG